MIDRVIVSFLACLIFHAVESTSAHELPDGFVEKAVEVVIRDHTAVLKYYVGLSDNTIIQLTQDWSENQLSNYDPAKSADEFGDLLLQRLAEKMQLEINAQPRKLRPISADNPGKHHFNFVVRLEFDLEIGNNAIKITDSEFDHMNGGARYSLKALGTTMLLKSNVAPIIIRAKRHELNPSIPILPNQHSTIIATVATAKPEPDSVSKKLN